MGYLRDRRSFNQGKPREFLLNSILARAGATSEEHDMFVFLAGNSLKFREGNDIIRYNDSRSGQAILFAFPFVAQVFMSLVLYQREQSFVNYVTQDLGLIIDETERVNPKAMLLLNSAVTKFPVTQRVQNFLSTNINIEVADLARSTELQFLLGIDEQIDFSEMVTIEEKLNHIFDVFRINATYKQFYIDLVKTNDRVRAASLMAQLLNYDTFSVQRISQFFDQWQSSQSI